MSLVSDHWSWQKTTCEVATTLSVFAMASEFWVHPTHRGCKRCMPASTSKFGRRLQWWQHSMKMLAIRKTLHIFLDVSQGRGFRGFRGFLLKLTHGYCSQILPISQHGNLMETLSPAIAPGYQKDCREGKGLGPDWAVQAYHEVPPGHIAVWGFSHG
jgi:hypothetical protein